MSGRLTAAGVRLEWNPSMSTNVAGYEIYYGAASRDYTNRVDAGNTTNAAISGLTPGATYYFAATARTADGVESPFSNEAIYTVPQTATNPVAAPFVSDCVVRQQGALLTWASVPARNYRVLYKTNLSDPQWLTDSPSLLATSDSLQWLDPRIGGGPQRFYTILLAP